MSLVKYPLFQSAAARRTVHRHGANCVSDLCFLEEWASGRAKSSAANILRASQIRRTNPALVQEIDRTLPANTPPRRHS
ncbi:hypothetical protein [Acetobacter orientalis]|uniref:hypothetical protein n=1 Tax=Acetobacter orientalis TaxID=146474 RepID=UPI0039EC2004